MERFIWSGQKYVDGTITVFLEDTADSYTTKDYVGPHVGSVTVNENDVLFIYADENVSDLVDYKKREGRLLIEFKNHFGVNTLVGKMPYFSEGSYQKVAKKLGITNEPKL